jgi:MFS transporter, NNP family, nitrate/nitrite transporter
MTTGPNADRPAGPAPVTGNTLMLAMATAGFAINFWAWALLGPLGPSLRDSLNLSLTEQAMVVAVPVIVGSLGRIPVGALTDRFGARTMFPTVSFLTILPVLYLGHFATSYPELIVGGFFLGLGGTTFAIGIPFVNSWFPPERRGTALGIFGAGMGGTAIAAFTTVQLADAFGASVPFTLVAIVLAGYGVLAAVVLRDEPGRARSQVTMLGRMAVVRLRSTQELSFLYAVGFGGFVAFSVYLPTYLRNAYDLTESDASLRTAGFVVLAIIARPLGGWLSDKMHPAPVLAGCFAIVTVLAGLAAFEFPLIPFGTVAFLGMAAALGGAAGATFALVSKLAPPNQVGAVTGFVGAAGGLGGFFPPLVMGVVYTALDDYSLGYVLLALTAGGAAAYTWFVVRREAREHAPAPR